MLHPIIRKETQKTINLLFNRSYYILWVVPLLIENNLQKFADRILVVDVRADIQLNRIINRDKISQQYAKNILLSQASRQRRLEFADDIIENNKNPDDIDSSILVLHKHYMNIKKNNH
ncbi:dephospho-CoA kinase [Candidatus Blochmannia vicinus]|uniref:Dephospho-CoA kinase n=1 Tax=Candidatus Blochmannia vicinus (nom. nud.) TaxID=251540 RepID=A0ABY4SUC9_9ENTR|nr:dephospho-CoA kinase [Candidatus Blochmannia vicinus]URJ30697.1 dephospho-CoA kinase [Candidatus Blochmannia vicinus]URJ32840.1 dephospho-CoA kinase [Candidatus Blochmannia vicinus]